MVDGTHGKIDALVLKDALDLAVTKVGIVLFRFFNGLFFERGQLPNVWSVLLLFPGFQPAIIGGAFDAQCLQAFRYALPFNFLTLDKFNNGFLLFFQQSSRS